MTITHYSIAVKDRTISAYTYCIKEYVIIEVSSAGLFLKLKDYCCLYPLQSNDTALWLILTAEGQFVLVFCTQLHFHTGKHLTFMRNFIDEGVSVAMCWTAVLFVTVGVFGSRCYWNNFMDTEYRYTGVLTNI